ncbi:MAG: hypothetical protein R6U20_13680 [Longimonas sp.]|uniref:hypothetical protein n=1 Tax=Longimonas sp. TaxID=2039626 RepID=UPI0039755554
MTSISSNGLPGSASGSDVVQMTYASEFRATQARTRLQVAGVWAEVVVQTVQEVSDDKPAPKQVHLRIRKRDIRKARGVLKAMHLLPEADAAASSSPMYLTSSASPEESDTSDSDTSDSGATADRPPKEPDPPTESASSDEEATDDSADESAASESLIARVSFWQMMVWGAALLVLVTLLLLFFGGRA